MDGWTDERECMTDMKTGIAPAKNTAQRKEEEEKEERERRKKKRRTKFVTHFLRPGESWIDPKTELPLAQTKQFLQNFA